jgi:hypothetical protein
MQGEKHRCTCGFIIKASAHRKVELYRLVGCFGGTIWVFLVQYRQAENRKQKIETWAENRKKIKFEELIEELHVLLAEKNANIAEVKEEVIRVMESYKSNKDDWKKYAHFSAQRYKENDQKKHTILKS